MDRDLDDAIETAAEHTRAAQERLAETPVESSRIVEEAHIVERHSEDLHELASDAAEVARGGPGKH